MIMGHVKTQFNGMAVQPLMKGLEVKFAGTFLEQPRNHVGYARSLSGILSRAAGEGIFHRDQWDSGVLHEPGFYAARRNQTLDPGPVQ
ncbi:hypothetical protein BJA5080_08098 [Bradyrhizobium diazoefficiens SEMIA 5080]|uniref:Uncharacterized protein n=2 Tax=Bradyrhizobium TaxID=374 RepID=A0A837CQE3_9BRAD|nr:hypothetical protein BJA5080_08098 [Bradyrhizobium diazoefficiens SEMIA 5080]